VNINFSDLASTWQF